MLEHQSSNLSHEVSPLQMLIFSRGFICTVSVLELILTAYIILLSLSIRENVSIKWLTVDTFSALFIAAILNVYFMVYGEYKSEKLSSTANK